jgi:2-phospho-L-lactate guanylyltransferase
MRTAAVLPVKRFAQAKQRLGASVADPLRLELAGAMVADVLLALAQTESIERTIVVTRERSVAVAASGRGAIVVEDDTESGQSAAASRGVARAVAEGFQRVLCVPGDCPALDPAELDALLRWHADDGGGGGSANAGGGSANAGGGSAAVEVVIVPDRHGTGTNGLLLTPPDAITPAFGPDSCERHRALARAAGAAWRVERPPSLLLDIDTGADLDALRELLCGQIARASHTRAILGQPAPPNILSITASA